MRKDALVESVQAHLQKLDKTSRFHDRTVEAIIEAVTNEMITQVPDLDLYAKSFVGVPILQDSDTEEYYSNYPASPTGEGTVDIVDTISVEKGVRSINTMTGRGLQFAAIRDGELQVYSGLDINQISDVIAYRPEADRIVYVGTPLDEDDAPIQLVRMKLVIGFRHYNWDENYRVPGGSFASLLEGVVNFLRGIPPKDLLNNEKDVKYQADAQ